ncbi:hypothetical protein Salat_2148300 [Sesamum alatum]|uniref:Uncharacterized protein n=1 Tax=Sesamum alatum TaxID=300844 RepID=A0AAE1Y1B8_9LAMI|nr:hypothetical protein Salat_2148300 [Sesamum alatum]
MKSLLMMRRKEGWTDLTGNCKTSGWLSLFVAFMIWDSKVINLLGLTIIRHHIPSVQDSIELVVTRNGLNFSRTSRLPHLSAVFSDHLPLLLSTQQRNHRLINTRKPWRFEAHWMSSPDCEQLITPILGS